MRTAFSVKYCVDKSGDVYAADWDYWNNPRRWSRSYHEYMSRELEWEFIGSDLNQYAYVAILKHFGLFGWRSEFPIENVVFMSPAELCRKRREKEKQYSLERIEIISDTIGGHLPAGLYE